MKLHTILTLLAPPLLHAQAELPETFIDANRLFPGVGEPTFDSEVLARSTAGTLDQLLLRDPAFSLYRRQDATFAHPTSAGVSLRRTGATATSRTLVLRDGIPVNDPFGSWIPWLRYQPVMLDSVRIVPAARAAAWGNQSPAGTIQLDSRTLESPFHRIELGFGSYDTLQYTSSHTLVNKDGTLAIQSTTFAYNTNGHHQLDRSQRGAVDERMHVEAQGADVRAHWKPVTGFTLEAGASFFEEERGNGTVLSDNSTDALDFSLRATLEGPRVTHQATAYYQGRDYAANFSSVAPDRNSETFALNQFDVPATGIGGSYTSRFSAGENVAFLLGADARFLDGETNERVAFDGRVRTAGGEQAFLGVFGQVSWDMNSKTSLEASARIDYYDSRSGMLREVLTDGTTLTDLDYPDRDLWEPSFGLTLGRQATDTLHLSASVSTAFRAPTLNELYRPYRVRNDVVENNAALDPERFYSAELTASWEPSSTLTWDNTLFAHLIHDAIANVPIDITPAGTTARRLNVEEARVLGFESRLVYQPCESFRGSLAYELSETEFVDSSVQPLLEGEPFPHSPRHRVEARADWQALDSLSFGCSLGYSSRAFEESIGDRALDAYWSSRISTIWKATDHLFLFASIDNLLDETIETGVSSDDLVTLAPGRTFTVGARYEW